MIWLTTAFVLLLIFIVPTIFALALDTIPSGDQPGYDFNKRMAIYGERTVTQKFISKENNLSAIGTSIRNPNLKNKKDISLELYGEDEQHILTSSINGQNIEDGDFVKFVFPTIPDSEGKTFYFIITSLFAGPEETIEVFYNDIASENILEYRYDGKVYSGGLPIVTFHRPDSKLEVVKKAYSSLFSRLLLTDSRKI